MTRVAILAALAEPRVAFGRYVVVAVLGPVPDRRIERRLAEVGLP